jgi:hypothetical protein
VRCARLPLFYALAPARLLKQNKPLFPVVYHSVAIYNSWDAHIHLECALHVANVKARLEKEEAAAATATPKPAAVKTAGGCTLQWLSPPPPPREKYVSSKISQFIHSSSTNKEIILFAKALRIRSNETTIADLMNQNIRFGGSAVKNARAMGAVTWKGHHGRDETIRKLQSSGHSWPSRYIDVARYIASCSTCQIFIKINFSTIKKFKNCRGCT